MFEGVKAFLKGAWNKMFKAKTITDALQIKTCLSEEMVNQINLWKNMHRGTAPWCVDYVKSLRKEQGICREFANVALNEMELKIKNEKLDAIMKAALENLNEHFQDGLATGAMVIKPLGGDKVEYLAADQFVPIEFDAKGRMIDVVFVQQKKIGEVYYNRLERHAFSEETLTITNRAFRSSNENEIGREIPLAAVEEWAQLPESVSYQGVKGPDFGYYRNPISNTIDGSPCGVSIFEAAVHQLENADIQGARMDWEFESGERAINVDEMALQNLTGAKTAGLQVGAYFFSQAITADEAVEEARLALQVLGGMTLDLPLVYDWEFVTDSARTGTVDPDTLMDCIHAFCGEVERRGYEPMVYFNQSLARDMLKLEQLTRYPFWLAMYSDEMTYPYKIRFWQYSDQGYVPGIEGNVDLDLYFP